MKAKALLLVVVLASLAALAQPTRTLSAGSEVKVRTDTAIPAQPAIGKTYTATVADDVLDNSGAVAIPRGSRARLVAERSPDGKDTILDLRSVTVGGRQYQLTAAGGKSGAPGGLGANKRTAKYVGGGAAVGAILGGLLGGGKGAAIGAIVGGAGGAGAQVYTGKKKALPAETQLTYKLAQDLTLRPVAQQPRGGLQTRPQ